jgi:hypothetical protein
MPFGRPVLQLGAPRRLSACCLSAFMAGLGDVAGWPLLSFALRAAAAADRAQVLDAMIVAALNVVGVACGAMSAQVAVGAVQHADLAAEIAPVRGEPGAPG